MPEKGKSDKQNNPKNVMGQGLQVTELSQPLRQGDEYSECTRNQGIRCLRPNGGRRRCERCPESV